MAPSLLAALHLGIPAVLAEGFFAEVGEPVHLESSGTWARALPRAGGWTLAFARNGELHTVPLEREDFGVFSLARTEERALTSSGGVLTDHAIKRCPDGTWLHVATGTVEDDSDSAWAFRYDADLELLAEALIQDRVTEVPHHDPPVLCSRLGQGPAFPGPEEFDPSGDASFLHLDAAAEVAHTSTLPGDPRASGSSLLTLPDADRTVYIGYNYRDTMHVLELDADFEVVSEREVLLLGDGLRAYWPQGLLRVGEHYLVAFMGREDMTGGGDRGDVFLGVFDDDWTLLQQEQLTDFGWEDGAMRPWLARRGAQLLVTYDRSNQHYIQELTLDVAALDITDDPGDTGQNPAELETPVDTGDTGEPGPDYPDSGATGDSGGAGTSGSGSSTGGGDGDADSEGCGRRALLPLSWGLLGLLALRRRRAVAD